MSMSRSRTVEEVALEMGLDVETETEEEPENNEAEHEAALRFRSTGEGYSYVTDADPHSGRERPIYEHRLNAVAWGMLESLSQPLEIHHEIPEEWLGEDATRRAGIPWLNIETILEPVDSSEHPKMQFRK